MSWKKWAPKKPPTMEACAKLIGRIVILRAADDSDEIAAAVRYVTQDDGAILIHLQCDRLPFALVWPIDHDRRWRLVKWNGPVFGV